MDRLNDLQKRGLALGLLGIIVLALIAGVIVPLATWYQENKAAIQALEHRLESYAAIIGSRNAVTQQAAALQDSVKASAVFSHQNSIPLASADMQQRIKNAVTSAGGELTSTQNNPQKQLGNLLKISINVKFSGTANTLKNTLFELESAKPFMIIDKIKILGMSGQRNIHSGKIEPVDKVYVSADIASFIPANAP